MRPARIIQKWLIDKALGTDVVTRSVWPVYAYSRPDTPDNIIVVYGTGGDKEFRPNNLDEDFIRWTFQIYLRAKLDDDAVDRMMLIQGAISRAIDEMVTYNGGTFRISAVSIVTPFVFIGEEEQNKRRQYTMNIRAPIEEM